MTRLFTICVRKRWARRRMITGVVLILALVVVVPAIAGEAAQQQAGGQLEYAGWAAVAVYLSRSLWEVLRREGVVRSHAPYDHQIAPSLHEFLTTHAATEERKLEAIVQTQTQLVQLMQQLALRDQQIGEVLAQRNAMFAHIFDKLGVLQNNQGVIMERQSSLLARTK